MTPFPPTNLLPGTPSQTVGPYLAIGLHWEDGPFVVAPDSPGAIWVRGRIIDGTGEAVKDAMVETWQADPDGGFDHPDDSRGAHGYAGFRAFGRSETVSGEYAICTLKPGALPAGAGEIEAPHIDVSVFARGLLDRVVTRIYFEDESAANAQDPVLRSLPDDVARGTLVARRSADGYRHDIVLQGDHESVFFAL